jgi:hypothetical protein
MNGGCSWKVAKSLAVLLLAGMVISLFGAWASAQLGSVRGDRRVDEPPRWGPLLRSGGANAMVMLGAVALGARPRRARGIEQT